MHRWVDHTSEVELEIEAGSEREVFEEALRALGDLLARDPRGDAARREVTTEAADAPALLAGWLEELVYLAESEGFRPERLAAFEAAKGTLRTEVEGRAGEARHLVKAVTYHRLALAAEDGVWRARVVFDV